MSSNKLFCSVIINSFSCFSLNSLEFELPYFAADAMVVLNRGAVWFAVFYTADMVLGIPEWMQVMECPSILHHPTLLPLFNTLLHYPAPSPLLITLLYHHFSLLCSITTSHYPAPSSLLITLLHHHFLVPCSFIILHHCTPSPCFIIIVFHHNP